MDPSSTNEPSSPSPGLVAPRPHRNLTAGPVVKHGGSRGRHVSDGFLVLLLAPAQPELALCLRRAGEKGTCRGPAVLRVAWRSRKEGSLHVLAKAHASHDILTGVFPILLELPVEAGQDSASPGSPLAAVAKELCTGQRAELTLSQAPLAAAQSQTNAVNEWSTRNGAPVGSSSIWRHRAPGRVDLAGDACGALPCRAEHP